LFNIEEIISSQEERLGWNLFLQETHINYLKNIGIFTDEEMLGLKDYFQDFGKEKLVSEK